MSPTEPHAGPVKRGTPGQMSPKPCKRRPRAAEALVSQNFNVVLLLVVLLLLELLETLLVELLELLELLVVELLVVTDVLLWVTELVDVRLEDEDEEDEEVVELLDVELDSVEVVELVSDVD